MQAPTCATLTIALALGALAPIAQAAPTVLSTEQGATPVAAWAGTVAWSSYQPATNEYRLVVSRDGAAPVPVPIAPSPVPFDVDLGTNRNGSTYAVYTRCTHGRTGCDVYRASLATGVEQRLTSLSAPTADERDPTIFRGRIAFVRRERHRGRTYDVLRLGDTTSASGRTEALVKLHVDDSGLSKPELSSDRIAYVRSSGAQQAVHVRTLRGGHDAAVYVARSGGANFANLTDLSITDDLTAFTWARTNQGSNTGNRLVRYMTRTRRLTFAPGSSRYVSTSWASKRLGMAVSVDRSGTGTCFANVNDPPEATQCSIELTGPVTWNAAP